MLRLQLVDFLWLNENFEFLGRNIEYPKFSLKFGAAGENFWSKKALTALKVTLKRSTF